MKYGIFKRTVTTTDGIVAISFTSLQNPADQRQPMTVEADGDLAAASKAKNLLGLLGVKTHSVDGCQESIMSEFPNYFVGCFATDLASRYDTARLVNQINIFTPVPKD